MEAAQRWARRYKFLLFSIILLSIVGGWSAYTHKVLASPAGDDLIEHFADRVYSSHVYRTGHLPLWNPNLYAGVDHPALAQDGVFYLPNLILYTLFSPIVGYNISLVGHLLLTAFFMMCFLKACSLSENAAAFGAAAFALTGMMYQAMCVVPVGNSLAWVPALFYCFERFLQTQRLRYCLWAGFCLAMQLLAGWPQMVVLSAVYLALYAAVAFPSNRRKGLLLAGFVLLFVMSLGIGLVQILPTLYLKNQSNLGQLTYSYFGTDSYSPQALLQLIFPYFFGSLGKWPFTTAYWGPSSYYLAVCYAGILPLLFAALGIIRWQTSRLVRFAAVGLPLSLLLAFGTHTPLGRLLYRIPVYNFFRDHFINIVFTAFSIAILAAAGLSAVDREELSVWLRRRLSLLLPVILVAISVVLLLTSGLIVRSVAPPLDTVRLQQTLSWKNPAILIPWIVILISSATALLRLQRLQGLWLSRLVILLTALDLLFYGYFARDLPTQGMAPPPDRALIEKLRQSPEHARERVFSVAFDHPFLRDNSGEGVPFADLLGFGSFLPYPYADLVSLNTGGTTIMWPDLLVNHRILALLNTRYVLVTASQLQQIQPLLAIPGDGATAESSSPATDSPNLLTPNKWYPIGIARISNGSSTFSGTPENLRGAQYSDIPLQKNSLYEFHFDVRADNEHAETLGLRIASAAAPRYQFIPPFVMGRESSAYSYLYSVTGADQKAEITFFTGSAVPVTVGNASLRKVADLPLTSNPYRIVGQYGDVYLLENIDLLPRAFFAQTVQPIRGYTEARSRLWSMSQPLDLRHTALVENLPGDATKSAASGEVLSLQYEPNRVKLHTRCSGPCFLVLTDRYYPGWKASIDSRPTMIYPTDGVGRGVEVPEGEHTVEFSYYSNSYIVGLTVSGVSVLVLLVVTIVSWRREQLFPA